MNILTNIVSQKPAKCEVCGGTMVRAGEIKTKSGKRKKVYRCKLCNHRISSFK